MIGLAHYRAAEAILANIGQEKDAAFAQALATRALAHATLASASRGFSETALPFKKEAPTKHTVAANAQFPRGADDIPETVVFQGQDVKFRARHIAEVRQLLEDEPRGGWDKNFEDVPIG